MSDQPTEVSGDLVPRIAWVDRRLIVLCGLGALLVVLVIFVVVRVIGGSLTVSGSVTTYAPHYQPGPTCAGRGLEVGDAVKVESDGHIVGLGQVDDAVPSEGQCVLSFEVEDVDDGHDFYSITIGDYPPTSYSRDDLADPLDLTVN